MAGRTLTASKMVRVIRAVAACACALVLCLGVTACGNVEKAAKEAFSGTWDLVEMSMGDETLDSEQMQQMRDAGLDVFVNLEEDGSAALVLFGEVTEGTWSASSTLAGTITLSDQDVTMTLAEQKLTFEQEGVSLTFQKGEHKDLPVAEAPAEPDAEVPAEPDTEATDAAPAEPDAEATNDASAEEAASE